VKTNPPNTAVPPAANVSRFTFHARFTFHVSRITHQASRFTYSAAFTLIELLVVMSIIGVLVAIAIPTIKNFKPNVMSIAVRQLQDDLGYARQRAISDHTTVYVLFAPSCADNIGAVQGGALSALDQQRLLKGQYVSYTFYEKRQLGDQPGNPTVQYLTGWRTLPEGIAIAPQKFSSFKYGGNYAPVLVAGGPTNFMTFDVATVLCSPETSAAYAYFPYVAFDYRGSLLSSNWSAAGDCRIPLTRGSVTLPRNATNGIDWLSPTFVERPPGAWSDPNLYTHIVIDGPTGRARPEQRPVQ
jgi:prepilin-type N-terminal cleavage/methylation domain-containing protein